jgi:hypothetical protein
MPDNQSSAAVPVQVRLPASLFEAIDRYRRWTDDLPSRPEAIRRLIEQGLHADCRGGASHGDAERAPA